MRSWGQQSIGRYQQWPPLGISWQQWAQCARWTLVAAAFVTILVMTWEFMAVLRAVLLGQIEGRPMGRRKALASPGNAASDKQSASCASSKGAGSFQCHRRGFVIPVDSLNQSRMAETLQRLILMIHKASAKLPKTGLNNANGN